MLRQVDQRRNQVPALQLIRVLHHANPDVLIISVLDAAMIIGSRITANRDAAIARLGKAGATLATVEMVAFEWMRTSKHPRFKDVLTLVR